MSSQQQQNRETDAEEVEEELDFDNFLQELEHELLPVEEKLPRDFTSDEEKAVVKLQAIQRGAKERNEIRKRKESATKLQAVQRGRRHRKELEEKKNAAIKLQALHRGHRDRKDIEKQKLSAIKMQAVHRGYMDRKKLLIKTSDGGKNDDNKQNKIPSPPQRKSGRNRANKRQNKKFARQVISKESKKEMEYNDEFQQQQQSIENTTVKWPKNEIGHWEKMIGSNYGVQWPKWSSDIPVTSFRKRKIKKYQNERAILDLEKRWDNGTKISEYRVPDLFEKKMMKKNNNKKNKKNKRRKNKKKNKNSDVSAPTSKIMKTDHQIEQLHILKTVRRVYEEAAGYYNANLLTNNNSIDDNNSSISPPSLPMQPSRPRSNRNQKGHNTSRINSDKTNIGFEDGSTTNLPRSPLLRATLPNNFANTHNNSVLSNNGERHVEIGEDGHYYIEEHFQPDDSTTLHDLHGTQPTLPFDEVHSMNEVLNDPSLLDIKFKETSEIVIQLWEELDVPYHEQSYIANHFFPVINVTNYIQIVTHCIFLQSIKSKILAINHHVAKRMELLQKIADVMTLLQQEENEKVIDDMSLNNMSSFTTTTDFSDNISRVYKSTRQIVNMIEDWKKLAPWNKVYYVDGEDYMETMRMELGMLENS